MKYYLLAMHHGSNPPAPEVLDPIMRDLAVVKEEMKAAGVWVFDGGLHGPEATTVVRVRDDGEVLTTDGPYAEGKEHLGGFVIIKAPDLDAALGWAARQAAALRLLPVEVRPFQGEAPD
jgi:hypothetical protein